MRLGCPTAAHTAIAMLLWSQAAAPGDFPDCNDNGVDDTEETAPTFTAVPVVEELFPGQLADIDGDGDLDMFGIGPTVSLSWRENLDGAGTFGPAQLIDDISNDKVAAGDFDGDGDPDLALQTEGTCDPSFPGISIYENLGSGTFGSPQVIFSMINCGGCSSNFLGRMRIADRESDGDLDIVVGTVDCSVGQLWTLRNLGPGLTWGGSHFPNGGYVTGLAVADLDGDAINDLVVGEGFHWFGGPSDTPLHDLTNLAPLQHNEIVHADLDGDGDPEIVGLQVGGDFVVYENASGLGNYVQTQVVAPGVCGLTRVARDDLDGDGDTDLLWSVGAAVWWSAILECVK